MSDLLLEIGTEELPASWVSPALDQLSQLLAERLRRENISFRGLRTYGTPRRLAAHATDVAPRQPDTVIEVRGPAARQAFDAEGNYTSAAFGFARSQSVFPEELKVRRITGGEYLFVERPRPGLPTVEIAARLLPEVIGELAFPKMMRWREGGPRFGRPIRWILALYGHDVIPFQLAGLDSGRRTRGHRVLRQCRQAPDRPADPLGETALVIADASAYPAILRDAFVVLDPQERRERIRAQVEALAQEEGAVASDDGLLEEIAFLAENPTAFRGAFDPGFLALPGEALTLVMRRQQRYFSLVGSDGALLPGFIGVRDGGPEGLDTVRAGNERVLRARFADIRYFYEEDLRVALADRVEDLRRILYQERLGTLYDKTERLVSLTGVLCDLWGVDDQVRGTALRAAWIAKADLASAMMKELPELQGTIGRAYALHAGEPVAVADAIADHYRPRATGDGLPVTEAGRLVGIADRADTLVSHFAVGLVPNGSQDPYALRRQASGLVAILVGAPPLSLEGLLDTAYALHGDRGAGWRGVEVTRAALLDFLRLRLESVLAERGVRYDTADAVLDAGFDDIHAAVERALLLEQARETPEFAETLSGAIRVGSLLRFAARAEMAVAPGEVRIDLLQDEPEQVLYGAYLDAAPRVMAAAHHGDYAEALRVLGELAGPINEFFDNVLVMSDEETLRTNRLRLLGEIHALFLPVADLTRLMHEAE